MQSDRRENTESQQRLALRRADEGRAKGHTIDKRVEAETNQYRLPADLGCCNRCAFLSMVVIVVVALVAFGEIVRVIRLMISQLSRALLSVWLRK